MFTVRFSLGLKHQICNVCLHWQKTNTTEFLTPTHTYTWTRQEGTVKQTWENEMEGCTGNFIVPMTKHYDQGNLWKEGHIWLMVHNGGAEVAGCRWHKQQLRAEKWELMSQTITNKKHRHLGLIGGFETSKPPQVNALPPARPYFLILPKQCQYTQTEQSNAPKYGHLTHTTTMSGVFLVSLSQLNNSDISL